MSSTAPETRTKTPASVRTSYVAFDGQMGPTETINAASVAVSEETSVDGTLSSSSDLTITDLGVNLSVIEVQPTRRVGAGRLIKFTVAGGLDGTLYRLRITGTTNYGQELEGFSYLQVVDA